MKADPKELEAAAKENVQENCSPSKAYVEAWEEYVKDSELQI